MLPSWLPALAIATRPATIKGADEILADMLRACGNVQAAAPTAEGRLLFSTRHQRVVVLAIAEACLEGAKRIRKKRRQKRAAPLLGPINELVREIGFWQSVAYLSDDRFRRKFRLSRAAFRDLATLLEPHLTRTGGRGGARSGHAAPPLSVEIKLSVALRFLAGAAVEDLDRYGVARKSSVMGSCVWPVVNAIHACPELEYRLLRALKSAKAGDTTELDQIQECSVENTSRNTLRSLTVRAKRPVRAMPLCKKWMTRPINTFCPLVSAVQRRSSGFVRRYAIASGRLSSAYSSTTIASLFSSFLRCATLAGARDATVRANATLVALTRSRPSQLVSPLLPSTSGMFRLSTCKSVASSLPSHCARTCEFGSCNCPSAAGAGAGTGSAGVPPVTGAPRPGSAMGRLVVVTRS